MTRREQGILAFLGVSIVAGAAALFWTQREGAQPDAIVIQHSEPAPAAIAPQPSPPAPEPVEVVVSVQGAVITPGVYRLPEGSRVTDLIKAAGGSLGADTADINLAAPLIDGTTLTVPERLDATDPATETRVAPVNPAAYTISGQGSVRAAAEKGSGKTSGNGRINLNRATQTELESLPGIGPKLAEQIIQYRDSAPFKSTEALMDVPGIGPQRYEAIRDLISVE